MKITYSHCLWFPGKAGAPAVSGERSAQREQPGPGRPERRVRGQRLHQHRHQVQGGDRGGVLQAVPQHQATGPEEDSRHLQRLLPVPGSVVRYDKL